MTRGQLDPWGVAPRIGQSTDTGRLQLLTQVQGSRGRRPDELADLERSHQLGVR